MMKRMNKLLAFLLTFVILAACLPVSAAEGDDCVAELINYYSHYQEEAQLDIEILLAELARIDEAQAAAWEHIMGYWDWVNTELDVTSTVLPQGLPQDDTLCIVVMGYQLKADGSLREELVGRLETALAAAEQYPNAYIACTGGPTATEKKSATEAGKMADWLVRHGISRDRIIVEEKSLSTISNARYTCGLIYENCPRVRQLAVITSDYHLRRSCVYFAVQAQLDALERGVKPLVVTGSAAYQTRRGGEDDMELQVEGVADLAGVAQPGRRAPVLSELTHIQVSGETQWPLGKELELQVRALYTSGRSRNVTYRSKFSGFDLGTAGAQQVTVTYQEGNNLCTAYFDVELVSQEAATVTEETAPTAVATALPEVVTQEPEEADIPVLPMLLIAAALALVLLRKRKK